MTALADFDTEAGRAYGRPPQILIVESEAALSDTLSLALRIEGWGTDRAHSCSAALQAVEISAIDAVVLDVQLPDGSGLELLHKLRSKAHDLPILLLDGGDAPEDRAYGLRAGGDDYVTKPWSVEEIVLRLRNLLKRGGASAVRNSSQITVGDLVLDEDTHEVTRAGVPISLTRTEFALLKLMMRNSRRVLTKTLILQEVWNYDFVGRSNVVGLYISYLRRKIDAGREPMIHTLRGVGYVLKPVI